MKVKELVQCWKPTGNLGIDIHIMRAIVEVKKLEKFLSENMPRKVAG